MTTRRNDAQTGGGVKFPTSSYINWSVRADFPTPPLPTMITLCRAREFWPLGFAAAMVLWTDRQTDRQRNVRTNTSPKTYWIHHGLRIKAHFCSCATSSNSSFLFLFTL